MADFGDRKSEDVKEHFLRNLLNLIANKTTGKLRHVTKEDEMQCHGLFRNLFDADEIYNLIIALHWYAAQFERGAQILPSWSGSFGADDRFYELKSDFLVYKTLCCMVSDSN